MTSAKRKKSKNIFSLYLLSKENRRNKDQEKNIKVWQQLIRTLFEAHIVVFNVLVDNTSTFFFIYRKKHILFSWFFTVFQCTHNMENEKE